MSVTAKLLNDHVSADRARYTALFVSLFLTVVILFILDIFLGSVKISPSEVFRVAFAGDDSPASIIILKFRIPKALTAVIAGIALSVSGLQMQTIFRNPMAGPYVLGISSGASLGVALVILGFAPLFSEKMGTGPGNWLLISAACAGAGLIMMVVTFMASRVRDILTILILGIMIGGAISALVTILQYFTSESLLKAYVIWTMGSLSNLTTAQLGTMTLTVISGVIVSVYLIKMLNVLQLGEAYATTTGVNVKLARILVFISTSVLAGSITAFCGPIGFIGIAVPHLARMIFRTSDHRVLLPACILAGASLLLLSDIISQLPGSDKVLPVNAITSLLGIPVVVWVIFRGRFIKYNR
ncbi:MAG: iron ABC transporter permease [Bacteroidales bacterium]|jgi:iron complex transport system permease protein|nr:iron ABC transporter permease [Bacteroidales bacterium]